MSNFPPIRIVVLNGLIDIKARLQANPDALDDAPYDNETKRILKELLAPVIVQTVVEKDVTKATKQRGRPTKDIKLTEDDQQLLKKELDALVKDLNELKGGDELPTNERIQIAKTKANLLEQLLKMMERYTHARHMEDFKEVVVTILNDLVTESDRGVFLARLEPYR